MSVALGIPHVWAGAVVARRRWTQLEMAVAGATAVLMELPWGYAPGYPRRRPDVPLVYVAQNAEYVLAQAWRNAWGGLGARLADLAEARERCILQDADLTVTITAEDAEMLSAHYGIARERLHVLPRGLDLTRYQPPNVERRAGLRRALGVSDEVLVVFAGSKHPPNLAAAEAVIELAQSLGAGYRCVVAGSIARHVTTPAADRVWLRPGDPSAWLQAADIAVNPMQSGSGMNVKMLEYLAWRLPVVSTPYGARGLPGGDGEAYYQATLSEFPAMIGRLATDAPRRAALGAAGRQMVEAHFSVTGTARSLLALLRSWSTSRASHTLRTTS
jgi:glycosyltransferase involved in cell wall biosynthesis